jgi:hypothetical protein
MIEFYGDNILSIEDNGTNEIYVPLNMISNNLGLSWSSQFGKIKNNPQWECKNIPIRTKSGTQKPVCIPLKNLNGWLLGISPTKIRPDLQNKLISYQKECQQVLYDYWTKGAAINPRMSNTSIFDGDLSDPNVSAKIIKMAEALHNANIERERLNAELNKAQQKIDSILGSKRSKPLMDAIDALQFYDPITKLDIAPAQVHEVLKKSGYFQQNIFLPYKRYCDDVIFGKATIPKVSNKGLYICINELLKNGYKTRNERIQLLITTNIKDQKALPMNTTKVNFMETNKEVESNDDSKKILEDLESKPVFVPPFKDQIETCNIEVPKGEKIH